VPREESPDNLSGRVKLGRIRSPLLAGTLSVLGVAVVIAQFGPALASTQPAAAQAFFGPKQYLRTTGAPNQFNDQFKVSHPDRGPFVLRVVNGDSRGGHRVSSASVSLNGVDVLKTKDFSQKVGTLERTITVQSTNTLRITLASVPGSYLTISVLGPAVRPVAVRLEPDPLPLVAGATGTLTATLDPAPAAAGRLTITSTLPGVAIVPPSVPFAAGQLRVPVPVTAGAAGSAMVNVAVDGDDRGASATVIVTNPPPVNRPPTVSAGGPYSATAGETIVFAGTASDPDDDPLTITWAFGDGATGSGVAPSHVYTASGTFTAVITADDGRGAHVTASAAVSIADAPPPPNRPPTVSAGGPYSGTTGQPIGFAGAASDPDGDPLVLTWNFGDGSPPAVGSQASHAYASAGTYTSTLTANDGRGGITSSSAQVTVTTPTPGNHDPAIVSTPPTSATEGQLYTYAVVATDVDSNDTLTFRLTQAPNGMTIGTSSGAIAWTPAAADVPSAAVTVHVEDGRGGRATQSFTIAVAAANHPPVFTSSPATAATEGRAYSYQAAATDPDGDALTFSLVGAPAGLTISAAGLIAWTPAKAQAGDNPVTIRVADPSGAFAIQSFTITVTPNTAPAIVSTPPGTATEATPYRYDVAATDADGDPLVFNLLQPPAGMVIAPAGQIDWTPGADQVTTHNVTVEVRDDRGGLATQTFTITVAALNRPPHINSTPVTTARVALLYNYQVHATDPNGDPIGYALTTAPAGMTVNAVSGLISWTPAPGSPSSVQVGVTASDGVGGVDTQTFEIAVAAAPPTNQAPRITSTPDTTGLAAEPYVYDVQAEDPDAGDVLAFSLVQPPPGMTINAGSGIVSWTPSAAQTGPFSVIVRVSDGKDAAQQAYELTIISAQPTNRPPTAHAGGPYHGEAGIAIAFSGAGSGDPDGDPLSFSWDFGDGSGAAAGGAPTHIYSEAGSFVVTLTVTDGRGGESARSTSVAVGAAGDRSPPSVTLLGPREVLPGDQVTLTAQAVDNVKVEKVTFEVDGGAPVETNTEPFQQAIAVPAVAAPGTTIAVKATATDSSGNAGSAEATLTIKARPDTENPVVALNAPLLASPGSSIHISASASDNAGIQSVGFSVNGASIATVTQPPYEATYDIPPSAPVGSAITVGAFALDFSANRSEASAPVTIIETADTQPPTVQLSASGTVVAGASLAISASAADNRGVSTVEFYVDGVRIASDAEAPYSATFAVAASAITGRRLQLEARAIDFAGLEGTDSRQTLVVSASSLAQGTIAGEVYDDTTGLPVEGVAVALFGADVSGQPYTQTATTDARGRYLLHAVEGSGVLRITRDGWTRIDRRVDIAGSQSVEVFDARVTPLSTATAVNPILGATLSAAGAQATLTVPTGALPALATLSLTMVSAQGLAGLLPPGWSVIGAVELTPRTIAFSAPATMTLPAATAVPPGAQLVLARWDEQTTEWRTVSTRLADPQPLTAAIVEGGAYAWVIGDTAPIAPPPAVAGTALSGVVAATFPTDAATVVSPQSKVLLYRPGVRSEVTGAVTPAAPMTSGTPVLARISEAYNFTSGLDAHPEPYVQDLVLYQVPGAPTLSARHVVTPSIAFDALALGSGAITIELFAPAGGPRLAAVIGAAGGTATAATGERVEVPPGSLAVPAPVRVRALAPGDFGFDLPAELIFAGGVELSSSGAPFAQPVTLSVSKPSQLPVDAQILIARIAEVGTTRRLVLVAVGRHAGDRIESTGELGADPDALEGVRVEGRYLFLRPASPVGFAAGAVRAINGDPFAGALVSVDTLPLFALSRGGGRYVAAAAPGAVILRAQDIGRNDTGSAPASIAAAAVVAVDLRLSAQIPSVLTTSPANQASNVPLSSPIVVTFSEPVNPLSITPASVVLAGADGVPVIGTLSLSNNNSVVTLRPATPLPADSPFTVTVAATIADLSGYTLAQAVTSQFTSLDVTAPLPPVAGAITASMPEANGTSTITATQGTANLHDTVSILNVTQGTTTPVLVNPSGGFTVIVAAALTDRLRLKIVDAAGNETLVALPRFSRANADGSVSVAIDAEGGRVDGPGGVAASIRPGTFPDGAIVTIKPIPEAAFPVQLTEEEKTVFSYAGGVQLDFGGQVPTQYVNVSVPAGPADKPGDQWIVSQIKDLAGTNLLSPVDTAKLIDGQVTTASPPCPGVTAMGVYGFHKSDRPVGITYASMNPRGPAPLILRIWDAITPFNLLAFPDDPIPVCYPVLSGRVTIVPNTVTLTVNRAPLTRSVDRIVVKNLSRGNEESTFARDQMTILLSAAGAASNNFEVFAEFAPGSLEKLPFNLRPGAAGLVEIALDLDTILKFASQFVIRNLSTNPVQETRVAADTVLMKFTVAGGATDSYAVNMLDAFGTATPAPFAIVPSSLGPGNLVARAIETTIDPTQAEIDAYNASHSDQLTGPGRAKVEIVAPGFSVEVPAASIIRGGFAFAFNGNPLIQYSVLVTYDDDSTDFISIPMFRMTISNPVTGEVVKEIVLPAPPADQPLNLGHISDDNVRPEITSDLVRYNNFDPSEILTFSFSEPMDAAKLKANFKVVDQNNQPVKGDIRISSGNTVVTFVPATPLGLGYKYVISFAGATDRGGNQLKKTGYTLSTIAPQLVGSFTTTPPGTASVRDIQILRKDVAGSPTVQLLVTTNTKNGNSVIAVDVTDPSKPTLTGSALAGFHKRQLNLTTDVSGLTLAGPSPCAPNAATFNGDLAITTSHLVDFTYVSFFDVTNLTAPCQMANKVLTATPDLPLFEAVERGTYHLFGVLSRGVATIRHAQGMAGYAAIAEAGLFAFDVGSNIPEKRPREKEPMLPGNYYDVVAYSGRLLALNRDARQLEVLSPTLALLSALPLSDAPRRIMVSQGFPFDGNGNGTIEPGESVDAAFIGGDKSIMMVDVTNLLAPRVVGMITMPTWINDVDVDRARRRLAAVDIHNSVFLIDLTRVQSGALVDLNLDGLDDRIIWTKRLTDYLDAVRIDKERPFFYVGTARGIATYALAAPTLSGTATFTYFPACPPGGCPGGAALPTGGIDYTTKPNGEPKPVRGAVVELRDGGGALLQTTTTDETGYYSFDAPQGQQLQVVLRAALARPENPTLIHLDVVDNFAADAIGPNAIGLDVTNPGRVWAKISPKFTIAGQHTENFYAQTVWTPGAPNGTHTRREAAPFAILDAVYQAEKTIRQADPGIVFPLLHMMWSPNNIPCGSTGQPPCAAAGPPVGHIGTTAYHNSEVAIYVLGAENNDTDEYDTQIMLHEWSHYFEAKFSRSDSPGGSHSLGELLDPRLAFGEGFATAHAAMLTGNASYVDTTGPNQGFGSLKDVENDECPGAAGARCAGVASGFFSEDGVMELLWDVFDPKSAAPEADAESGGTIQDDVELGYKPIYQAMVGGEKTTPAFTSIFSFMKALTAPYAATPATLNPIRALSKAENIDLTTADEYELSTRGLYTVIPVDGTVVDKHGPGPYAGQPLQTRTVNGISNKLDCRLFFKFTVLIPGHYEVLVTPTNNKALTAVVSNRGTETVIDSVNLGDVLKQTVTLLPGDYVMNVSAQDYIAPNWTRNVQATFKVSITLTGVFTQ
jgi:PKD repeat protein